MKKSRKSNPYKRQRREHNKGSYKHKQKQRPESASFHPSPFSEKSRKQRAKKRRRDFLMRKKPLVILTIIAVILALAALVAVLPYFYIEEIEVEGAYRLDADKIKNNLLHHKGNHFIHGIGGDVKSFLTLHYGEEEEQLMSNSHLLQDVDIYFSFPYKIKVKLEEKTEILCLRVAGGYALLDKDLIVMEINQEASNLFPSLEQISLNSEAKPGQKIETDEEETLKQSINLISQIIRRDQEDGKEELLTKLDKFFWIDNKTFYLHINSHQGGVIRVKIDDNRYLQDNLNLLTELIFENDLLERSAGELDMTGKTILYRPDRSD